MTKKSTSEPKAEHASGRHRGWSGSFAYIIGRAAGAAGRQVDNLAANTASMFRARRRKLAQKPGTRASHADPVVALVGRLISVFRQHSAERYRRLGTDPAFWAIIERLAAFKPRETSVASVERSSDDVPPSGTRSAEQGEAEMDRAREPAPAAETKDRPDEPSGSVADTGADEILLPTESESALIAEAGQPAAAVSDAAKKATQETAGSGGSARNAPAPDSTTQGSTEDPSRN